MRTLSVIRRLVRTPRVLTRVARNRLTATRAYSHEMASTRKLQLLVLIATRRCNLRCEMCMQDHEAHRREEGGRIGLDEYRALLDEVRQWDPAVQITGGEPLVYREIDALIEAVKERGLFCMMNTNGTLLEKHAEHIVRSRVEKLTVSIEGPPEVHDYICRVKGAHQRALAGIQAVAEEKKRRRTSYPFIDVKAVITPANVGQLESVVRLLDTGWIQMVDFVHMWFLHESQARIHDRLDTGVGYYQPHDIPLFAPEALERAMGHVRELQRRHKSAPFIVFPDIPDEQMRTYYSRPEKPLYRDRCIYPYETARILPNGDILACPEDIAARSTLGNLREASLTEIVRGERAKAFLKKLDQAGGAWPICTRCCGMFRS